MNEHLDELRLQITTLTKLGHEKLAAGSPVEASEIFRNVCSLADQTNDEYIIRGCSFNMGACHVASGQSNVGIKYLEQAIPPSDTEDGVENYADLWYNIGVARHAIGDIDKALVAYEKALLAYQELTTKRLEGECLTKLAVCYHLQSQLQNSYDMYQKSQELYGELGDKSNQALCLVSATGVLSEMGDIEGCAKILDVLLDVCQEIEDKHLQAKIYHDIGLLYISEKLYESAAECFEQSLKCLEQDVLEDKSLKAIIMQNLGAACNYLKFYDRAIHFHHSAGDTYGELGDRHAQTQVFCNLAYAYTQQDRYQDAVTAFQHAIQAAKDSGDKKSQCLATEGMAAIRFRLKEYEKAISYYKDALMLISLSTGKNSSHADRIVEKLTDAIQSRLLEEGQNVERTRAKKIATEYRGKLKKGRPRISRALHESLIAKGLEEISSYEDSSEQDSSSDDIDSQQTDEVSNKLPNDEKQSRLFPPRNIPVKHNHANDNGMNFSMKSTLSKSHQYELPRDYADVTPRADEEYYLATVAQKRQAEQKEVKTEVKESSKMCAIM